jgi:hypothetical protein
MTHPDDTVPMPLPVAPQDPAFAAQPEIAAADGAPYRVPAPPIEAPEPALWAPVPRKPRPIVGPALSVFAVLLWAFVVFGQFTTSWLLGAPLGQTTAVILVLLTTFVAWIASVRRSRAVVPPRSTMHLAWRGVGIAALAFMSFVVCVVAATAIGAASAHNHDMLIAIVLVAVSMLAALAGPRSTSPGPLERTRRQRSVLVMLWIAGVLLTLIAAADLAKNG